jgi:hypothetical protein
MTNKRFWSFLTALPALYGCMAAGSAVVLACTEDSAVTSFRSCIGGTGTSCSVPVGTHPFARN